MKVYLKIPRFYRVPGLMGLKADNYNVVTSYKLRRQLSKDTPNRYSRAGRRGPAASSRLTWHRDSPASRLPAPRCLQPRRTRKGWHNSFPRNLPDWPGNLPGVAAKGTLQSSLGQAQGRGRGDLSKQKLSKATTSGLVRRCQTGKAPRGGSA